MVDLTIDGGSQTLDGAHTYGIVTITNGGILYVTPYNGTGTTGTLILNATEVNVDNSSSIIGFKRGYRGGATTNCSGAFGGERQGYGGGANSPANGAGGGGYGTVGGNGASGGAGGPIQGTFNGLDIQMGNGGGAAGTAWCNQNITGGEPGGAMLTINAQNISIHGTVNFDGGTGGGGNGFPGGGASGGGILLNATNNIDLSFATITARGGAGGVSTTGGGIGGPGGAGRIKIFYSTGYNTTGATITTGAETVYILPMTVIVNTTPVGATILIDNINYGASNKTIDILPGSYELRLSLPCYETIVETLNVVAGDILTINRALTKNTGDSLTINSTPSGANVYIDGVLQPEVTPITPRVCVPEGAHNYGIYKSGYQTYRGTYNIVRSTSTAIDATLLLLGTPNTGSIDIRSDPIGAEIFLDDIDKGVVTPSVLTNITAGSHIIRLTKQGYLPVETTITVDMDTTDFVFLTFLYPLGSLSFVSTPPGAEIFLALTGQTPEDQGIVTPATISLQIGSYDYILRLDGYNDITGTADVTQGITTPVSADLILSEGCVSFSTDVPGASIRIDGILQEGVTTPAIICGLTVGPHTYELALTGYQTITGDVTLTTGHGETVTTTLVSCIPNWVCRQPLDGYEHDTNNCGTPDRLNSVCNATPVAEEGMGGIGMLLVAGVALGAIMTSRSKGPKTRKLE